MAITPTTAYDVSMVISADKLSADKLSADKPAVKAAPPTKAAAAPAPVDRATAEDQMSKEDLQKVTDAMNGFMKSINTDIKFSIHEKTKQLMVQVIDTRDNTVLKEFPPHELLDTIAAIQEYVGVLLDKKV